MGGVRKRGKNWYYYFDAGTINGKRNKIEKVGGSTKEEAEIALKQATYEYWRSQQTVYDYFQSLSDSTVEDMYNKVGKEFEGKAVGIVYFISDGLFVKVGLTTNSYIHQRISTMQTGNPRKLYMIAFCVCEISTNNQFHGRTSQMMVHEKEIQNRFLENRVRGEWFAIRDEELFTYADINRLWDEKYTVRKMV